MIVKARLVAAVAAADNDSHRGNVPILMDFRTPKPMRLERVWSSNDGLQVIVEVGRQTFGRGIDCGKQDCLEERL